MGKEPAVPGTVPPEPTYAQSIEFDPKSDPNLLAKALTLGVPGAAIGGILGAGKAVLGGGDLLRSTLAGALTGGAGVGGTTAYLLADPIQRGLVLGQAYEAGLGGALENLMKGKSALGGATQSALQSILSGRGRFTPEEKKSLIQQFTQTTLPSAKGWNRRIRLAQKTAQQLMGRNPARAIRGLKVMQAVMPDVDTRAAVQHAIKRISSGQVRSPHEKQALGALGRRILNRLNIYRQAAPQLSRLADLKRQFARGEMSAADFAARIGLLTGRFGGTREEVARMRQFLQEVAARPVGAKGSPLTDLYVQDPDIAALYEKAFARGRGA
jgi:hypothetical protein